MIIAGVHRPGGHDNRWNIETACRHDHAGRNFIAVRQQHEAVKLMRLHDGFDHVGNQFARREGVVHPGMSHRDAVADAGDREEERQAAAGADAPFDFAFQCPHPDMAGNQVGKA